jgi:hypothetical protein
LVGSVTLGLHQAFGPAPLIDMLLAEITEIGFRMHMILLMKGPMVMPFRGMNPVSDDT